MIEDLKNVSNMYQYLFVSFVFFLNHNKKVLLVDMAKLNSLSSIADNLKRSPLQIIII